jgi:hypothetical protein
MSKILLTETILPEQKPLIVEAKSPDGFMYLKGLFLEGATQNHNGRVYPRDEIEIAVNSINERIQDKGPIAGELDHPEGLNINFDRISHLITEMSMEGNNGMGTMKIINAGLGLIVRGVIDAGMVPGVSSRGSGNIGSDGNVSEFDIITIDIVANPSAPNAYPQATLAESLELNKHGREALTLTQFFHEDPAAQKYLQKEISKFLLDVRDNVTWRK